ncbi:MAG: mycofactocin biosynthesis peptidyl-dipeptidase MftE [Actinomycetota bacterium]
MSGSRLEDLTTDEVDAADRPVLLIPLGATEQHGPHLPLDTDTVVAAAWAEAVAARLPGAVVGPALPYGSSGEHQGFAGTLSIGQAALRLVLVELARSARNDFDRIVFLSGHAGNAEPVRAAVAQLRDEGHDARSLFPTWSGELMARLDAHAGYTETSLLLHLDPDRVRLPLAEPGATEPLSELLSTMRRDGVVGVSANGVLGDPTDADAGHGRALFEDLVDRTVAALAALDRPGNRPSAG